MATSADRRGWRDELKPWQRFTFRLMLWYGGAAALLVAGLSWWSYNELVGAEMDSLRGRIGVLAEVAVQLVDPDAVSTRLEGAEAEAYWDAVAQRFLAVGEADPDAGAVYLLRWTGDPSRFETLIDVRLPDGRVMSRFREVYDGSAFPELVAGRERRTVESELIPESYDADGDGEPEVLWSISGYAPVLDAQGHGVAVVGVDVFAPRIQAMRRAELWHALAAFAVGFGLLGAVTLVLGRQIVQPLGQVIDATDAVASGDLDVRIRTHRHDEFGLLGRYFDAMADGLKDRAFLRDTFGRYVSPRVAEAILANRALALGGEEREVTILFTDLRGYSSIAEAVEPQEVVRLLNEYLEAMNRVVDAHEGVVIEYTGDGILAVFGAPVRVPDHAGRAVACAVAMRARLDELNAGWEASGRAALWKGAGIDRVVMRIGLHTGRVVAGNLGSESRMKYAVIGDVVNVAARLEQLNKELGTTILASAAVRAAAADFAYTPRGAAKVKGRGEPVEVFSL